MGWADTAIETANAQLAMGETDPMLVFTTSSSDSLESAQSCSPGGDAAAAIWEAASDIDQS